MGISKPIDPVVKERLGTDSRKFFLPPVLTLYIRMSSHSVVTINFIKLLYEGRKHMSTAMERYLDYGKRLAQAECTVQYVENLSDGSHVSLEDACRMLKISFDDYKAAKKILDEEALAI